MTEASTSVDPDDGSFVLDSSRPWAVPKGVLRRDHAIRSLAGPVLPLHYRLAQMS